MKVQIEIEIPDGHEIVDMEVLADEYPRHYSDNGKLLLIKTKPAKPFLINGVPSDWPEWLTCDWVTKDEDGGLYLHKSEPQRESDGWFCTNGVHFLDKSLVGIDIPGPWEQSKRENPRRKK